MILIGCLVITTGLWGVSGALFRIAAAMEKRNEQERRK